MPAKSSTRLTSIFPPDIKPVYVGEYCASLEAEPEDAIRRWWDGSNWSQAYYAHESDQAKASSQSTVADEVFQGKVYWRGLAKKPS